MNNVGIAKTVNAAKNLPSTTEVIETGEVKRIWSVFCFLSSLKSLIVRIGETKRVTMYEDDKTLLTLGIPLLKQYKNIRP